MDFKPLKQPKAGSLSSLRAEKVLRPSPLADDQNSSSVTENKDTPPSDQKRSTPDNIRRLRSQKVYSSPSDNIMTPITRKLVKKNGFMLKMDFDDNAIADKIASMEDQNKHDEVLVEENDNEDEQDDY